MEAHRGRGRSCETGSVFLSASLSLGPVSVTRGRSEVAVLPREPPRTPALQFLGCRLAETACTRPAAPISGGRKIPPDKAGDGVCFIFPGRCPPAYLGPGTATGQGTLQTDHPGGPQRGPRRGWGPGRRAGKPGAVRWEGTRETSVACCGPRGGTWGWVACHGESPDPASSWKGVGSWRCVHGRCRGSWPPGVGDGAGEVLGETANLTVVVWVSEFLSLGALCSLLRKNNK